MFCDLVQDHKSVQETGGMLLLTENKPKVIVQEVKQDSGVVLVEIINIRIFVRIIPSSPETLYVEF